MTNKTLPTLTETASIASNTLFLVRRNGQVQDEKLQGSNLQSFIGSGLALTGGTVDNTVIGGTTASAATFTTVNCATVNTGQGNVECYAMDQAVQTTDDVTFNSAALTVDLAVTHGGTGASTASGARTNLGLGTAAVQNDTYFAQVANNLSDLSNTTTARTNLGLGSLAVQNTINNGDWSGVDLSVVNGGTGASNESDARTNLGVAIGSDVQAYDAGLQSISGLTTAIDQMIYTTGADAYAVTALTAFARSLLDDANASDSRTTLGLGSIATQNSNNVNISGGSISGITDLAIADGGTGAGTASGARSNLGLGSIATQDANNVSISGGSVTGIADIAITDGGTGASTASGARTNLDVYSKSESDNLSIASIVATATASNNATIDFASVFTAGNTYRVIFTNVVPSVDNQPFQALFSDDGGSTFKTSGYKYFVDVNGTNLNNNAAATMALGTNYGSAGRESMSGEMIIFNPADTADTNCFINLSYLNNNGSSTWTRGVNIYSLGDSIDSVRFQFNSGNIESGIISIIEEANQ